MITIGGTALPSDPGEGGAPLSTATPQPPGTPAAGTTGQASDAGHVHLPTTAAQAGALATALLTTRGDLIRRGAAAAERVALGAAGTRLRSDGTDPVWSEPDIVCTVAELATTYAPSAVLRGVIAYTTDAGVTYVCRRTAASTYAWALLAAGATAAAARAAASISSSTETDPLTSSAAWTLTSGTGTVTLTGGLVTLTTASGASTPAPNRPTALRSLGVSGARGIDVAVRLASWSGTLGSIRAQLIVGSPVTGGATDYSIFIYGSSSTGELTVADSIGGAFVARLTSAAILSLDGQDWLRIITSASGYSAWTGRGTTLANAVWTMRYVYAASGTTSLAELTTLSIAAYRNDVQAQAFVTTFADLRIVGW